jgi:hypothetical protein
MNFLDICPNCDGYRKNPDKVEILLDKAMELVVTKNYVLTPWDEIEMQVKKELRRRRRTSDDWEYEQTTDTNNIILKLLLKLTKAVREPGYVEGKVKRILVSCFEARASFEATIGMM